MKAAKKVDMTQGSIMKRVLLFALPICVGNVLQQLYGTVDTLVIGRRRHQQPAGGDPAVRVPGAWHLGIDSRFAVYRER